MVASVCISDSETSWTFDRSFVRSADGKADGLDVVTTTLDDVSRSWRQHVAIVRSETRMYLCSAFHTDRTEYTLFDQCSAPAGYRSQCRRRAILLLP